ncbi:HK97 family phage prohead protease [Sphingomonas immobilis]|uniref:HK97 family phage prohead protease n=1 Tax=Sphingomonas immobilis TaxID=3063997 RepID=A0ABT9A327_9SPHN|nr:HK97 family phage prohead protease [Sphingomonas sp. CA1-15]MDO7843739.1 HK97 family phage prohead protease [Sphingomonas sp. CA1-15]
MTRFAGYAAVFDRVDRGGDVVRAGAFGEALSRGVGDVPLLWQHRGHPVGVIERAQEDAQGLRVIGRIDDARLAALVRSGAVRGLSFGYRVRAADRRGVRWRELLALDLVEVSLVAQPMQPLARVVAVGG